MTGAPQGKAMAGKRSARLAAGRHAKRPNAPSGTQIVRAAGAQPTAATKATAAAGSKLSLRACGQ